MMNKKRLIWFFSIIFSYLALLIVVTPVQGSTFFKSDPILQPQASSLTLNKLLSRAELPNYEVNDYDPTTLNGVKISLIESPQGTLSNPAESNSAVTIDMIITHKNRAQVIPAHTSFTMSITAGNSAHSVSSANFLRILSVSLPSDQTGNSYFSYEKPSDSSVIVTTTKDVPPGVDEIHFNYQSGTNSYNCDGQNKGTLIPGKIQTQVQTADSLVNLPDLDYYIKTIPKSNGSSSVPSYLSAIDNSASG